ncbi:hypothetical protein [Paenibacillus sp. Marseille-Q4541]|uniref:hypothetical protein n=1 Tax=Paenibacillus sp. Marseille-Q4541 TaxID=2831522 RepID=UPI001BAB2D92|nr:hypothetical protein [Paenibacillus sp. Marseille-Q4541]
MAVNRRLNTDADFEEAMNGRKRIRVFQDNHQINNGGLIIRFDQKTIVIQSSVSDLAYHDRNECEFFEIKM